MAKLETALRVFVRMTVGSETHYYSGDLTYSGDLPQENETIATAPEVVPQAKPHRPLFRELFHEREPRPTPRQMYDYYPGLERMNRAVRVLRENGFSGRQMEAFCRNDKDFMDSEGSRKRKLSSAGIVGTCSVKEYAPVASHNDGSKELAKGWYISCLLDERRLRFAANALERMAERLGLS